MEPDVIVYILIIILFILVIVLFFLFLRKVPKIQPTKAPKPDEATYNTDSYNHARSALTQLVATAGLLLTINFGIVSIAISQEVLESMKYQVSISGFLLVLSIFAGVIGLGRIIELQSGRGDVKLLQRAAPFQFYTFSAGLVFLLWAVLVRVGAV